LPRGINKLHPYRKKPVKNKDRTTFFNINDHETIEQNTMKTLVKFIIFLFIVGCGSVKKMSVPDFDCKTKSFQYDSSFTINGGIKYYIAEDFANQATKDYTIEAIQKKYTDFFKQYTEPTTNIHDTSVVDTIYKFHDENDTIEFYRAKHKDLLKKFNVTSPAFSLYGCISTGMKKDSLLNRFNIKHSAGDVIKVGNEDKSAVFTIQFKNNQVQRIVSTPYLD